MKKTFKREEITQHKEVLKGGLFVPSYIKKTKKNKLNTIQKEEAEEEIHGYILRNYTPK